MEPELKLDFLESLIEEMLTLTLCRDENLVSS